MRPRRLHLSSAYQLAGIYCPGLYVCGDGWNCMVVDWFLVVAWVLAEWLLVVVWLGGCWWLPGQVVARGCLVKWLP